MADETTDDAGVSGGLENADDDGENDRDGTGGGGFDSREWRFGAARSGSEVVWCTVLRWLETSLVAGLSLYRLLGPSLSFLRPLPKLLALLALRKLLASSPRPARTTSLGARRLAGPPVSPLRPPKVDHSQLPSGARSRVRSDEMDVRDDDERIDEGRLEDGDEYDWDGCRSSVCSRDGFTIVATGARSASGVKGKEMDCASTGGAGRARSERSMLTGCE